MASKKVNSEETMFRLPPFFYLHALNQNTNVTQLEVGPQTFIRQDHIRVLFSPVSMITVPPRHYCIVRNPVERDAEGKPTVNQYGQYSLKHADTEIRMTQAPFPLYPGEEVEEKVTPLKVVDRDCALKLKAIFDFQDNKLQRKAGDQWLFLGPDTYLPRKEVVIVQTIEAVVVKHDQAIKLQALKEFKDSSGNQRVTGEVWLWKKIGAYLPGVYEEIVNVVTGFVLTEKIALHLQAKKTFVDDCGIKRKNGEEWLIKMSDMEVHIPGVYEKVIGLIKITTLTNRQFCVILDPADKDGRPQMGTKKLIKGAKSFFVMPCERLQNGIENIYILGEDEGLILRAEEEVKIGDKIRLPGDKWMIRGPKDYVPPVEVTVVKQRVAIPLDENEGIYVRNNKTGKVRAITGESYMLNQDEDLWEKELTSSVEILLDQEALTDRGGSFQAIQRVDEMKISKQKTRNKHMVITYRVPHNACVQIYDYKLKKAREVFGPELVMLYPDEQFTQLALSGGKPKKPNQIRSLCLLLGPDFCTDIIVVETADHARLQLQLAYNWHFDTTNLKGTAEAERLFSVPDFVGDACKAIASRIRGAVASVIFDDFHKNSAKIIRTSVFGLDDSKKIKQSFVLSQNNLVITNIDIQGVEPVDQRTRDSLQKSVQLAIEITTNSLEAAARQQADRLEQEAKGSLKRQKIMHEAEAEKARKELLELLALSAAVESTGQAKAEAQSKAESSRIAGEANVENARLIAIASKIESDCELNRLSQARTDELKYTQEKNDIEISRSMRLANIDSDKFKNMVDAIGKETLVSISMAGPEMQVKLLQALGLKSTLITDGSTPINLFDTANGLIGGLQSLQK